jgi:hypothetical protein
MTTTASDGQLNFLTVKISARFRFQLTVSANPLAVVGWRLQPES